MNPSKLALAALILALPAGSAFSLGDAAAPPDSGVSELANISMGITGDSLKQQDKADSDANKITLLLAIDGSGSGAAITLPDGTISWSDYSQGIRTQPQKPATILGDSNALPTMKQAAKNLVAYCAKNAGAKGCPKANAFSAQSFSAESVPAAGPGPTETGRVVALGDYQGDTDVQTPPPSAPPVTAGTPPPGGQPTPSPIPTGNKPPDWWAPPTGGPTNGSGAPSGAAPSGNNGGDADINSISKFQFPGSGGAGGAGANGGRGGGGVQTVAAEDVTTDRNGVGTQNFSYTKVNAAAQTGSMGALRDDQRNGSVDGVAPVTPESGAGVERTNNSNVFGLGGSNQH